MPRYCFQGKYVLVDESMTVRELKKRLDVPQDGICVYRTGEEAAFLSDSERVSDAPEGAGISFLPGPGSDFRLFG